MTGVSKTLWLISVGGLADRSWSGRHVSDHSGPLSMRAMLDLALRYGRAPVPVADIAEREDIPVNCLQQRMGTLRRAGLVRALMGPHGGFELACSPAQISVGAILRAAEGQVLLMHCLEPDCACPRTEHCLSRRIWASASRTLNEFLDSQTLQSAMNDQRADSLQPADRLTRSKPHKPVRRKSTSKAP